MESKFPDVCGMPVSLSPTVYSDCRDHHHGLPFYAFSLNAPSHSGLQPSSDAPPI